MQNIRFSAGLHVRDAAALVAAKAVAGQHVRGEFNGIVLSSDDGQTEEAILSAYKKRRAEANERYTISPAGIAAKLASEERLASAQSTYDRLAAQLPSLDFANDVAVLDWLCAVQDATDHIGVAKDKNYIIAAFAERGFLPGVNTGPAFDANDRDNSHRWLVGQALETLSHVAIHPIIHKFAAEWKAKFATS